MGAGGLSSANGLTSIWMDEAQVVRTMIANTVGQLIVVALHTKWGVVTHYDTAPLSRVDCLVTDDGMPVATRDDLQARGIRVVTVPAADD